MKKVLASLFLFTLLSLATGCGEGKSGVILRVTTATPGIAPVAKPHPAATGDGAADFFPDRNLTPHSFTIAFTSFKLFREDQDATTTPTPDYTVFDIDPTRPIVVSLTTGETVEVKENNRDPRRGRYNLIEYTVRYFEMTIPLCSANTSCEDRRLRFYLTDNQPDPTLNFTPTRGDILISRSRNGTDFSWVSQAWGLPASLDLFPITGSRPNDAYQVPLSLFPPPGGINPVFRQSLSPLLEIEENPKEKFVFTLSFDLSGLFFFDNTDEGTLDTETDFHFNALLTDSNSRDGKILRDCAVDSCKADFWPAPPPLPAVSANREDRKD